MSESKTKNLGRLALFGTTLIWGSSFVIMKSTLDTVSPLWVLALRFSGAAAVIFFAAVKKLKMIDRQYLRGGILMGTMLAAGYIVQTYGLYYTTPGKNAFLTATYCILVPFLYWLIYKRKPDGYNIIAAVICLAGMGLVCLQNDLSVNIGDLLTICCGLFYGLHIIITANYAEDRDPIALTLIQFAVAAVICFVFALIFEPAPQGLHANSWFAIAYLSIMCTAVCFLLQTFGQKYTPPSGAALIMTLESVFGTILSIILGKEILTFGILCGFALIFIAVVISETKLDFLKKK